MTSPNEQIEALSRSVTALDGARRVGFGRAYTAQGKLDEALRDLNVTRGDRDIYRRALSWLYGFIDKYVDANSRAETAEQVKRIVGDLSRTLDSVEVNRGRRDGRAAAEAIPRRDYEQLREWKAEKRRDGRNDWRKARMSERDSLGRRYGFADGKELVAWLDENVGRKSDEA